MRDRLALCVMGAWIAGSLVMVVVATENFATVDRLLEGSANASFRAVIGDLTQPRTRDTLRYLSSELNRLYFGLWNTAQIGLSLMALWLLAGQPRYAVARRAVLAMAAVVLVMTLWLQPEITSLGRSLDFVPRDPAPAGMSRFWTLHAVYTGLELAKLGLGLLVAFWIARPPAAAEATRAAA